MQNDIKIAVDDYTFEAKVEQDGTGFAVSPGDYIQRERLFRALLEEYIWKDVKDSYEEKLCEKISQRDIDKILKNVAHRFAWKGEWDEGWSYWANIDALVQDELRKLKKEEN